MRTFIAIDIPDTKELKDLFTDFTVNCKGLDIKYSDLINSHLTLAFLGETTNSQVTELCESLEAVNLNFNELELDLLNIDFFRNGQIPSVIWVGIVQNRYLEELWNKINLAITSIGLTIDKRKFQPHLTIGRVKRANSDHNLDSFKAKYNNAKFGTVTITEFVYFQSILTPNGPIYKPIQKFKF